jgi:predicted transcriptional regulator
MGCKWYDVNSRPSIGMTNKQSDKRAKTLKDLREATGRSATWIAQTMGVDRRTVYRWEKGDPVSIDDARLYAVILGKTLDEIADSQGFTLEWARAELENRIEARQGGNHEN